MKPHTLVVVTLLVLVAAGANGVELEGKGQTYLRKNQYLAAVWALSDCRIVGLLIDYLVMLLVSQMLWWYHAKDRGQKRDMPL